MDSSYMTTSEVVDIIKSKLINSKNALKNAIKTYQDEAGMKITDGLRTDDKYYTEFIMNKYGKVICTLDGCFTKYEFDKPLALFRGVVNLKDYFKNADNTYMDKSFVSTTTDLVVAKAFVADGQYLPDKDYNKNSYNTEKRCCVLHIHVPAKTPIMMTPVLDLYEGMYSSEKEILLPRNTVFKRITDEKTLNWIQGKMKYAKDENGILKTSEEKDGFHIVPVEIVTKSQSQKQTGAGKKDKKVNKVQKSKYVKTTSKFTFKDRSYVVYTKMDSKKKYIKKKSSKTGKFYYKSI